MNAMAPESLPCNDDSLQLMVDFSPSPPVTRSKTRLAKHAATVVLHDVCSTPKKTRTPKRMRKRLISEEHSSASPPNSQPTNAWIGNDSLDNLTLTDSFQLVSCGGVGLLKDLQCPDSPLLIESDPLELPRTSTPRLGEALQPPKECPKPLAADAVQPKPQTLMERLKAQFAHNSSVHKENVSVCLQKSTKDEMMDAAFADAAADKAVIATCDTGPFYGLPQRVKEILCDSRGISQLYPWQDECLRLSTRDRRNLVYSLPTSGGKTLVAEILLLRELLCYKRDALLILPYVAVVQEKVRGMAQFAMDLDFVLEEYASNKGQIPPRKRRKRQAVYIATIEKAHTLVNALLELRRIDEIGLVVVDEIHMLGSGNRGAILEMLLAKIMFQAKSSMIVGMSATLSNLNDLQSFLDAELFVADFRPVQLHEYVKVGDVLYVVNSKCENADDAFVPFRTLSASRDLRAKDPDLLSALVLEVIPKYSCLVFCPTKKNCENVALLLCRMMSSELLKHEEEKKQSLLSALITEGNGYLCPVLKQTIPYGIAYHHSGLTVDERKNLEEAYSSGVLCCLTCTSTLAAGVNLPARRVILRSPYVAREFMSRSQYKQMTGRAGRAGIDDLGESIIIIKESEAPKVAELVNSPVEACYSCLVDNDRLPLRMMLVGAIGLELIHSESDALRLLHNTLLRTQSQKSGTDVGVEVRSILEDLKQQNFIRIKGNDAETAGMPRPSASTSDKTDETPADGHILVVTRLGRAAFKGSVEMNRVERLYADLQNGLNSLVLNSFLHLLYLITPYELVATISIVPDVFYEEYMSLSPNDVLVAQVIGVPEVCIIRLRMGHKMKNIDEFTVQRFYIALVLYCLWKQQPLWKVADKFRLPRGQVQSLLTSATSFGVSVLHFCQELEEFWAYQQLLDSFVKRLSYCATSELIPLMELPAVNRGRAFQLYKAGFKTLQDIARADPSQLVKHIQFMSRKVASQIINAAKLIILQQVEALQEAAEDMMASFSAQINISSEL